jgi:hypothetical protein
VKSSIPHLVVRATDPRRTRRVALLLTLAWVLSLGLAWWYGHSQLPAERPDLSGRVAELETLLLGSQTALGETQRKLANFERSDQVSRTANASLQETLREREEEIAALRADLAFYQRLVGGRSPRQGLTVHSISLSRIGSTSGYGFRVTLSQNLKKAAVTSGSVELSVEGMRDRKLATLRWPDLVQDAAATPLSFQFKYFQQLDGNVVLPDGFTPSRVRVVVKSKGGEQTEQAFAWDEALAAGENEDVRQ